MTGLILTLITLLATWAGAAWIIAPLLRRAPQPNSPPKPEEDVALDRSLRMMDDLQADLERGAISHDDFAVVSRDIRREAAAHLQARDQLRAGLDSIIKSLTTSGSTAPRAFSVEKKTLGSSLAWLGPGLTLMAVLTTIVVAVTIGTRDAINDQRVIGNIGITNPTGMSIANDRPENLLVTHTTGTMLSQDGGQNWEPADVIGPAFGTTARDSWLYILTTDHAWTSADGGKTWNQAIDLPPLRHVDVGYRSGFMAGITDEERLVLSIDTGTTWTTMSTQPPQEISSLAIVDFGTPFVLVATRNEGVLAYNQGKTWRSANGFVNGALPTVVAYSIIYAPNTNDQFTSPTGQEFVGAVFVATDAGVFKSVDGMQSWQALPLKGDIRTLGHSPVQPRTLFAIGNNGAVYRSDDAGNSWQ
ncbi:MAG TPA: hypothetical protein DGO43_02505 [Chloroflexi bacterium]|nr:hypothetical protein [Chloroflexota bacterium]|tara:strand:- start:22116 stop:23363 length:1248 start_codon:yes stop_codon:yes gene_type:complete